MSKIFNAKVLSNNEISPKTNILVIKPLEEVPEPQPGQFYMIGVSDSCEPLLKRPFSFFKYSKKGIHILFSVRGKGTLLMKKFLPEMILKVIGPLGNGYKFSKDTDYPLFVAGGTGIASIYSLIAKFNRRGCLIYGARCKEDLALINYEKKLCESLFLCTDDGSLGEKGTVIDILKKKLISKNKYRNINVVYACGPKPMLKALSELTSKYSIQTYVSLEERMACGFGSCLGCAINTINGYKMVCKDGPVFPSEDIIWD